MVLTRVEFRRLCLSIIRSRIDRAYISSHASRLLRLAIYTYAADDDEVRATVEAILLNVPHRRITVAAIAGFLRQHLNMPITQHPRAQHGRGQVTTRWTYRALMDQRTDEDGTIQVLVDWEPTWEPVVNVPGEQVQAFQSQRREERAGRRSQRAARQRPQ
jgi:hypothetical protein